MNRIQKKCLFGAAGLHGLLIAILVVGPGFLTSPDKPENRPMIDFEPSKTLDEVLSGGGSPRSGASALPPAPTPAPAPKQPTPQPRQPDPLPEPPQPKPEPVKPRAAERQKPVETAKPVEKDPDGIPAKPTKPPKRALPDVSLKQVVRKPDSNAAAREAARDAENKRIANENRRADEFAKNLGKTISQLRGDVGTGSVDMPKLSDGPGGPGGGGPAYANFLDAIKRKYTEAWVVPDGVTDDEATVTASITIAKDGKVLDYRVIGSSGNSLADQSVRMVLRRVTYAVPLPDNARENQRTVTIKFNVKAKRGLG